jgi:hypothetical protein
MSYVILREGVLPECVGPFPSASQADEWQLRDMRAHGAVTVWSIWLMASPEAAWAAAEAGKPDLALLDAATATPKGQLP